ncbi:hypothetical protein JTB14_011133 [Gonioctena quinquepunctata]|nr:hypothetical protein JTB14_011133 [Gonioctena quinquepunctata]
MRYDHQITYTPGKNLSISDTLSRKPIPSEDNNELEEEVDAYIHAVTLGGTHTCDDNLIKVANSQSKDTTFKDSTKNGLPNPNCRLTFNNSSLFAMNSLQ